MKAKPIRTWAAKCPKHGLSLPDGCGRQANTGHACDAFQCFEWCTAVRVSITEVRKKKARKR